MAVKIKKNIIDEYKKKVKGLGEINIEFSNKGIRSITV